MIVTRWSKAGFPTTDRVDIVATLYSIGIVEDNLEKTKPHDNPVPNDFDRVALQFFESDILVDIFPHQSGFSNRSPCLLNLITHF